MKFIGDLKDEELLPIAYDLAEDIADFCKKTKILDIRKQHPKDGVSVEEQGKENIKEMLKTICKKYPKETAPILRKMWILEDGETEDDIPPFPITLIRMLNEKWLLDFFSSAVQLM